MNIRLLTAAALLVATGGIVFAAGRGAQEKLPKMDRAALAKTLRAEAAKLADQIKPLDAILKPYDLKAAMLRDESARWKAEAAAFDAEAAEIERSSNAVSDPRPNVQQAAASLRNSAGAVRNVRNVMAAAAGHEMPGRLDEIARATGVDIGALAGALENSAQGVAAASSAEMLQAEITRLNEKVLRPLKDGSARAEQSRRAHAERYARLDPDVKKKSDEIGYWMAERDKHHANMAEAERRCAASAKDIGMGIIVCTDLQSKAWFLQAQTGAAQADAAINLAHASIAGFELQRVGDRIGMVASAALTNTLDAQIASVEQKILVLENSRATLVAMRNNAAKQPVAKQKRELAASARSKAAASEAAIPAVYQPVADMAKARNDLQQQRSALVKKADGFEYGRSGGRSQKRFGISTGPIQAQTAA